MRFCFGFTLLFLCSLISAACLNKESAPPVAPTNASTQASTTAASPVASTTPGTAATLPPIPEKLADVTFTDVTAPAGIRFRHNNGASGNKYLPETTGSGCAWLDYDNDGWQDLLLINSMDFEDAPKKRRSVMALYHNNKTGSFTDVTASAGLTKPMYGM